VHGVNQVAMVILLCKKKDIREEQRLKEEGAQVRKEKRGGIGMAGAKQKAEEESIIPPAKCLKLSLNGNSLTNTESPGDDGGIEVADIEMVDTALTVQNRQSQYHKADRGEKDSWQQSKGKGRSLEEDSPCSISSISPPASSVGVQSSLSTSKMRRSVSVSLWFVDRSIPIFSCSI